MKLPRQQFLIRGVGRFTKLEYLILNQKTIAAVVIRFKALGKSLNFHRSARFGEGKASTT
jgi:hypothetical protein